MRTPVSTMLDTLKFLNVKQRIILNLLVTVFKLKKGDLPVYMKFKLIQNTHNHNTRQYNNVVVSYQKVNYTKHPLYNTGFKHYNNLPRESKDINIPLQIFKKYCVEYVKNNF